MKNKITLVIAIAVTLFITTNTFAQVVTSEADDGSDGTLRQEIADTPAGGTITFDAAVETVTLTDQIEIDKTLTITGPSGSTVTIDVDRNNRVFRVIGGTVEFNNLTITGGQCRNGAGIYLTNATVTVNNCFITDNRATNSGSPAASGGGISNDVGGVLFVNNSEISNNIANRAGGGIEDNSGAGLAVTLNNVNLDNNNAGVAPDATAAPGNGGGLHITGAGEVSITGGTVNGNIAAKEGGGLWNGSGTMTVDGTMIDGNDAQGAEGDDGGGGIFNNGGTLIVQNDATVSNNTASGTAGSGGGIFSLSPGTLNLDGMTISGNTANRAGGGIEIASNPGELYTFANVTFRDNVATGAGDAPGNGGAYHISGGGDSTFTNVLAERNTAVEGGGLWNGSGTMTITGSDTQLNENEATGDLAEQGGGALYNDGGTMNIEAFADIYSNIATGVSGSGGAILSTGGTLNTNTIFLSSNGANRAGGGIEIIDGTANLIDVSLISNDVNGIATGGAPNPGNGGGVHITGNSAVVTISGIVFLNEAASEGGGLWNNQGTMTVQGGVFYENTFIDNNKAFGDAADNGGGGIFNNGGSLTVNSGTNIVNNIAGGTSGSGGGIQNVAGGNVTVLESIITGNSANRAGGGIEDNTIEGSIGSITLTNVNLNNNSAGSAPGNGGGLHMTGPGNSTITGGTVNGNTATLEGGGLWNGSGAMTVDGTTINGNDAQGAGGDDGGGGIFNNGGVLTVTSTTTITNNTASGTLGSGGGIFSLTPGTLNVDGLTIENNTANRAGGGIEINSASGETYTFNNVTLSGNTVNGPAPGNGGGLHISGMGDVVYNGGAVTDNTAFEGGGLWNSVGSMSINGTTITGNTANGDATGGGGLFNNGGTLNVNAATTLTENMAMGATPGGRGGAIFNNSTDTSTGELNLANGLSITGNYASRAGGAIEDSSNGTLILNGVTLTGNSAGVDISLGNTITPNPGNGGGVHLSGTTSATIADFSTISNNFAAQEGGGLWNNMGTMDVSLSFMDGNIASGDDATDGGGAIFNNGGTLIVGNAATISNNVADGASGSGGAIFSTDGSVTISGAVIAFNRANRAGGAVEVIDGSISISGNYNISDNNAGVAPAVAAPGNGGALHISGTASATITGGTMNDNLAAREGGALWNSTGTMTVDGTTINGNDAQGAASDDGGGGIFNNGGTLMVQNGTMITGNTAMGTSGSGGGIFSTAGTVTITDATLTDNEASRAGGGIEAIDGSLVMSGTTLNNNNAGGTAPNPGNGGGLHISGSANADITGGTVNSNVASREGGGLWNSSGTMTVDGVTIDGNIANGPAADDGGAGIFNNGGVLVVQNGTTISNNVADGAAGSGGGILNNMGTLTVSDSEITANTSIRAGGGVEENSIEDSVLTFNNVNLNGNSTGGSPGNGGGLHITGPGDSFITGGMTNNNTATNEGGGLWNGSGIMTIIDHTVDGNTASGNDEDVPGGAGGGGIYNEGGTVNLSGSSTMIANNVADGAQSTGGGILNAAGTLIANDIDILDNTSNRAGGGIETNGSGPVTLIDVNLNSNDTGVVTGMGAPGNGGGLHVSGDSSILITGGTVNGNTAATEGGGLWNGSGIMALENVDIIGNTASGDAADNGGGGVFNNGGDVGLVNGCIVNNNSATGLSGSGGGLLSLDGIIGVYDATFDGNAANRAGGAIELVNGDLAFVDSVMSNNDVNGSAGAPNPGNGGGMHITGSSGSVTIATSTITGNSAANEGGGLWNQNSIDLNVSFSTIDNNSAAEGGGIYNNTGALTTVFVSTISGNSASVSGGGLTNNGAVLELEAVTVAQNTATVNGGGIDAVNDVNLENTIVALNTAPSGADVSGTFTSSDYNLIGTDDLSVFPAQSNDIEEVDPMLGPLADNGGSTLTHQLMSGSPAYDAGDPSDIYPDQIGQFVFGDARDIGAFESQDVLLSVDSFNSDSVLSIYPNPTKGKFDIIIDDTITGRVNVQIVSMTGKLVKKLTIANGVNNMDITGMASGVYVININTESGSSSHKLVLN